MLYLEQSIVIYYLFKTNKKNYVLNESNVRLVLLKNLYLLSLSVECSEDLLGKSPSWSNYFLCGVKGAREYLQTKNQLEAVDNFGFLFAVTGNIPESSGLSSSSALVTAAMMATLVGYGVSIIF